MNDRIHAFLDGDLPREELTPDELAEAMAFTAALDERFAGLRGAPVPDLTARIMAKLAAEEAPAAPAPAWNRAAAWLWRSRTLSVRYRPAYVAASLAAAALAAVVVPSALPTDTSAPMVVAPVEARAGATRMYVQFRLEAPAASDVRLAGSFTGWRPELALSEVAPGVWSALVPLQPGVHDYTFLVDGERWVVDPYAPNVEDSFGGSNSRLFLPSPRGTA